MSAQVLECENTAVQPDAAAYAEAKREHARRLKALQDALIEGENSPCHPYDPQELLKRIRKNHAQ